MPQMTTAQKSSARALGVLKAILFSALVAVFLSPMGCTRKTDDKDNSLNVVLRANVKGLDPLRANDQYSSTVVLQIFEGLLQYHYLKRPYTLQPALAESMPTASADGLTHTFKIKKGVKFQDNAAFPGGKGREVVAQDFIYSYKRLADPKNSSEGFWIFDGKIKGLNEWADAMKSGKASYDTPVEGLSAPDSHTLVIKLTQPYYQLYYVLAMGFAGVVPKEAVDKYGEEFLNNPVGTGPYMLEKPGDWVRNSKITLKKNPNWRGETYPTEGEASDEAKGLLADKGKPLPFADALVFTELPEDSPRWQNFMKGNFEFVEIPNDNFDSAVNGQAIKPELGSKGMRLDIAPNIDVTYTAFNMKDPILGKNKDLRHAMSLAQNVPVLIEKLYNGRALPAQGPIPPGIDAYDPEFKNPWMQYNVEKAKEALKKAGYPDGKGLPALTLETLSDTKAKQIAQYFADDMKKIGITVNLAVNTWPQFQEKIKNGQAQMFGIAWGADYPDAQNFLMLYYSKNWSPGPNDSWYSNAEFDKLYEQSLKLPPGKDRDALYVKMRDIVVEDAPWIFATHRLGYRLVHGWVSNFKYNEIQQDIYKYLRVDPKKRAELKDKL